ncbi:MAG TPA: D-alanine--D-alanine ligase [Phycisphaerae bacterium]|nr:D-alanine--D-alanine ligase [Phycisphaerae bacterium]HOJ75394.1 D-alanine--D-alanine ligase [Phycisphaerae bacterium]HOM52634.1 D-alanine--D-alanine ligase [Phycisphaerae bacterium]HOQ87149.1 D-alanine--D-alanine ligase [Phycisphaerae bacterium]HPP27908.1 D-alanine--D-alanine ligase [Phycisphaerae bacterium]
MIVGLTYDLRADYLAEGYGEEETAEFDRPDTIDAIESALRRLGHETQRIGNVRRLVEALAVGRRWDLVFNIAEGLRGVGRESQVPALLDAYDIPYTFSDPVVTGLTLHKGLTKHVLASLGIPTAGFKVVECEADIADVHLPYPLFVKPVAEGTAKGITAQSKVRDAAELERQCRHLLATYRQPVLVETFLPGREVTVGITGTGPRARAIGTLEIVLLAHAEGDAYTYVNKENCEELCRYQLADASLAAEAEELALRTWRGLGCRDAGRVDLRADAAGRLCVLEVNPLAGLHPEHSDLPILCTAVGIPYVELIERIVASAMTRVSASAGRKEPGH